ncbi:hypothetical protein FJT64_023777 [Amphibalanus amphitrite]|uniref:Endonuclease/exonuclease/phosphatase domain-containing protein n=1 Tax=Amphibalanus amphitrite TaxID=1232801 RepID=A0A6A4WQP9_AMPAM|nr:hypothetical protein FJT64_023777 [Amphibalanus amphitrite]
MRHNRVLDLAAKFLKDRGRRRWSRSRRSTSPRDLINITAIRRKDRPTGRSGGGVAVLYRHSLSVERLRVPAPRSALEALWLQVTGQASIIIGAVYRPPSCPAAASLEDLHRQLTAILARGRPIYMLGDTNFVRRSAAQQARRHALPAAAA